MKRTISTLLTGSALCLAMATGAQASPLNGWSIDLSTWNAGVYTGVDQVVVSGTGQISQSFGADRIFNNGDTFTEMSLMQSLSYWTEPGPDAFPAGDYNSFSLNGQKLYLYGTGLTGYVYDVTPGPTLGDYSFKYKFNPGAGSLGIYLDNNANPLDGVTATLAEFSLVSPSGGQGPAGFLGGLSANGTTDLTAVFTNVYPGVWKTADGTDFNSLEAVLLGLVNTHNTVTGIRLVNPDQTGADGFQAIVRSEGALQVAVPEPSTFLLLGAGLAGLGYFRKRKNS